MKKSFLLITMMGIALMGFSQNILTTQSAKQNVAKMKKMTGFEVLAGQSQFTPTRSIVAINENEVATGLTYDWQSNAGLINRAYSWSDGTTGVAWTHSRIENFSDRGTGVNYFDGSAWTIPADEVERVENEKTGFGAYAPWGPNGEVTVAHSSSDYLVISMREEKGTGDWQYIQLDPPAGSGVGLAWPGVWTSGENREYIHIITNTDAAYADQTATVLYSRYNSATSTWEVQNEVFEEWNSTHYPEIGSNGYTFLQTEKEVVAFVINDPFSDAFVMASHDNGQSWEQIMFYQHPNPFGNFDSSWFFYPRHVSGTIDKTGKLHLAYEYNGSTGVAGSGSYYPGIGGIVYWNEDMPVRDTTYLIQTVHGSSWYYSDAVGEMPNEYVGYLLCIDQATGNVIPMSEVLPVNWDDPLYYPTYCGETFGDHGLYNSGIIAQPQMMVDDEGNIYVIWIGVADGYCDENNIFYRIFGRASSDGGQTWNEPVILTKGFTYIYTECVYPYMAQNLVNGKVCITYQRDAKTGTFVQGDHPLSSEGAAFINLMVDPQEFGITVGINENTNVEVDFEISPNPASSQFELELNGSANVSIYNMVGQLVRNVGTVTEKAVIDVTNFAAGVYLISATQNGKVSTQKLIVR